MELTPADFPSVNPDAPEVAESHPPVSATPPGRADLAFTLRLPRGWEVDPASLVTPGDGREWSPLAAFGDKATPKLALAVVLWKKIDFDVPLDEWTTFELARLGVNMISFRLAQDLRGPAIDIGGTCSGQITPPGQTAAAGTLDGVVRVVARLDGPDLLVVWALASRELYPTVAQDLALAGASFRLHRPPTSLGPEPVQQITAARPDFKLDAPDSWTHQPMPEAVRKPGKSGLNLILAPSGSLDGFIRVKAIDPLAVTDLNMNRLVQDATDEMAEGGVTLTAPWQPLNDSNIGATPDLEIALIAAGTVQNATYEIHFGVVQRPPLIFAVTAILVALQTDPVACMRGRRAYWRALATTAPR